jgi:hypothetical protein
MSRRMLLVPVSCYLSLTLICPLLDGQRGARYGTHALTVLLSCVLVLGVVGALALAGPLVQTLVCNLGRWSRARSP